MSDIFFEPWEGPGYKLGIKTIKNNEIVSGTEDDRGLIVMALGRTHYCREKHCDDANKKQELYTKSLNRVKICPIRKIYQIIKQMNDLYKKINDTYSQFCEDKKEEFKKYRDKLYVLPDNLISDEIRNKYDIDLSKKIERIIAENLLWEDFNNVEIEEDIKKLAGKIKQIAQTEKKFCGNKCILHDNEEHKCAQLPICRKMTKHEIDSYINGIKEEKSHKRFRRAFLGLTSEDDKKDPERPKKYWRKVLFANFFQRGMPYTEDDINWKKCIKDLEGETETKSFIEIFKKYKPNIIFIWGEQNDKFIWKKIDKNEHILNKEEIYIRYMPGKKYPKISIDKSKKKVSFTILDLKDGNEKKHSCLLIFHQHPTRFSYEYGKYMRCAIENHQDLKKWDPNKNQQSFPKDGPITCKFDENFIWDTKSFQDFQKCI